MKKMTKRLLAVIVSLTLALTLGTAVYAEEAKSDPISEKDFLSVKGSTLVNADEEPVLLHGVNLGGWMIQESWMCPIGGVDGDWANLDSINALAERGFTEEQIDAVFETYQENYITEFDLDFIARMGCNVVRVPFWYRNFMKNEQGEWINDDLSKNPGFIRLDWLISECGKRGIYVILDLHGCPGGQSTNHCCGTLGRNELYGSEELQNTTEKLWTAIAERYKDEPTVAAYDVMNEPQNNDKNAANYYDPWEPSTWEITNKVYDRLVKAIRRVDERHVITVEGIWRVTNLPDPADMGWYNMMYQVHLYDSAEDFKELALQTKEFGKQMGVAVYVGEFSEISCIDFCSENGINWTTWSYKGGKGANGTWFCVAGSPSAVNWQKDDYDTIMEKFGEPLRTDEGDFGIINSVAARVSAGSKIQYTPSEDELIERELPASLSFSDILIFGGSALAFIVIAGIVIIIISKKKGDKQ